MANVIQALNNPTLIISHNQPLAGQLYGERKEFFLEIQVVIGTEYITENDGYAPIGFSYFDQTMDELDNDLDTFKQLGVDKVVLVWLSYQRLAR